MHDGNDRGGVRTASTGKRWKSQAVDKTMQIISHQKVPLSVVIGGLKRAVTKYANEHQITFGWQSRFYYNVSYYINAENYPSALRSVSISKNMEN